jgi:glycosyltransferase involved in cell wall biosynthesis
LISTFTKVVVVDDASQDQSASIAARVDGVRVVRHPINLGQGAALQTGLDYVLADPATRRILTFDADGQHQVGDAAAMAARLGTPADDGRPLDIILGSRFAGGRRGEMGAARRLILRAATLQTRLTTRLPLTDTHNGLRAFTRPVAQALTIRHGGMAHATEILEQIASQGWAWAEHPVEIRYSDYTKAKGQSSLNAVNILTDLLMRPRR